MSTGQLAIRLSSPSWGTGSETVAMAEVTAAGRSATRGPSLKVPIGVNDTPKNLSLDAGPYLVRLFLPSGDVQAERVEVEGGGISELTFDIGKSPHEWLGSAASLGIVQTLPSVNEARSLKDALNRSKSTIFRFDGFGDDDFLRCFRHREKIRGSLRVESHPFPMIAVT